MQIAILNNFSFEKSHLARLREVGTLTVHDDTSSEGQAIARLKDVEIALVDGFKMPPLDGDLTTSARPRFIGRYLLEQFHVR